MKIQLLGTSAAPTWPDVFNRGNDYCYKIKEWKGKNIRSRSQTIINDEHVIDFGFDTFYHSVKFNINFANIRDIFITHSHVDHFNKEQLGFIDQVCFGRSFKYPYITLYGNEEVIKQSKLYRRSEEDLKLVEVHAYEPVVCEDGFKWTPIPANHIPNENALNYIIEHNGKTLLYKVDSGPYTDPKLWDFLSNFKFDCIITEGTFNFRKTPFAGHEIYDTILDMKKRLIEMGCIEDKTPFWLTHIHYFEGGLSHEEAEEITSQDNIHIGYDGAVINI